MTNEERIAALEVQVVSLASQVTSLAMDLNQQQVPVLAADVSKADTSIQDGGLIYDLIRIEGGVAYFSAARIADLSAQADLPSREPKAARQISVKDLVTPEMRKAAEEAVMIRLCDHLGPHHHWEWIVDDVIEALSQTEVSPSEQEPD